MAALIILIIIAISCAVLKKAYHYLSVASSTDSDMNTRTLYFTRKHTDFINIFLDLILLSSLALFAIAASFTFNLGWALLIIILSLLIIFIVIPNIKTSNLSIKFAEFMAKPLTYVLKKFEKPITKLEASIAKANRKFYKVEPLSKDALMILLKEQKTAAQAELKTDLELAIAGLSVSSQKVGYFMVRKQKAKIVDSEDLVGPILLSELYDTGRKVFPAKDKEGEIAGTIKLSRLAELKSGGKVKKSLDKQVIKVEKNETALSVLKKFIEEGCELLNVENEGKIVGFVYLEDVIREFIGNERPIA